MNLGYCDFTTPLHTFPALCLFAPCPLPLPPAFSLLLLMCIPACHHSLLPVQLHTPHLCHHLPRLQAYLCLPYITYHHLACLLPLLTHTFSPGTYHLPFCAITMACMPPSCTLPTHTAPPACGTGSSYYFACHYTRLPLATTTCHHTPYGRTRFSSPPLILSLPFPIHLYTLLSPLLPSPDPLVVVVVMVFHSMLLLSPLFHKKHKTFFQEQELLLFVYFCAFFGDIHL